MLEFYIYDVFTDQPFSGNPLAIVMGADALTGVQMQTIARQFNLSETIFVMKPQNHAHTARVRIFSPTAEIPFAGHPTIGCALHLSDGADAKIFLEEEAGLVPVEIRSGLAEFIAPKLPVEHPGYAKPELIARALDLSDEDIGFNGHVPGIWQGGPAFLYAPVRNLTVLGVARPIEPYWSQVMQQTQVDSVYLYTPEGDGYRTRMFSPTAGIPEDPATGSAAAILAAQLLKSNALPEGKTFIPLQQGIEMGRPSQIGMTAHVQDRILQAIHVRGQAIQIAKGNILIPPERA